MRSQARVSALDTDEVHIWHVELDAAPEGVVRRYEEWLPGEERREAARRRLPSEERRALVARAVRREILSDYLSVDARGLRFGTGFNGKPYVEDQGEDRPGNLRFNLAHSDEIMLLAVTDRREVGVDVERIRELAELDWYLDRCLTSGERRTLRETVSEPHRMQEFHRIWARKEAWLKASGLGLSGGLSNVAVSIRPDGPPRVVALTGTAAAYGPEERWWLRDLSPGPGWVAALAGIGPTAPTVVRKRWSYEPGERPRRSSPGESRSTMESPGERPGS